MALFFDVEMDGLCAVVNVDVCVGGGIGDGGRGVVRLTAIIVFRVCAGHTIKIIIYIQAAWHTVYDVCNALVRYAFAAVECYCRKTP